MIPLQWFLVVSAALFSLGLYAVLARRNAVGVLMGVEFMLNAANLNLVAFGRHVSPADVSGQVFAIFVITLAAAEVAVGLALIIAIYRSRATVSVDEINLMRG